MPNTKFTKGELKKQHDSLKQYQRYLPALQLKKQQIQMEIFRQSALLEEKERFENLERKAIEAWAGLLADVPAADIRQWIVPKEIITGLNNVAGVDIPVFERLYFQDAEYDLFLAPLWFDRGIEALRQLVSFKGEITVIKKGLEILTGELRLAAQRVNLFEKVKIPQTKKIIHSIKIYIGDQMVNAVGRSKIAKRKLEEYEK